MLLTTKKTCLFSPKLALKPQYILDQYLLIVYNHAFFGLPCAVFIPEFNLFHMVKEISCVLKGLILTNHVLQFA